MIPVRLTLRNFLSYGDAVEPIDFTEFRVVCLSGNNGHGKSALLDAITWVLWGQARAASADDLVRLGQPSMLVEFEFDFSGHRYRVIRKRTKGRSGQSDLQFQIRNEDGTFRTFTEQGVRATQERINETLRMDYETFINSAFILQGRADEFARKGATDRKRILGEILNLRVYDELVEEARARSRNADQRRAALDAELRQIDAELVREPEHREAIERCQAGLREIERRRQEREAERSEWAARKIALDGFQHRYADLAARLDKGAKELATWHTQLAGVQARLEQARELLAESEVIRQQVDQLAFARRQEEQMGERLRLLVRMREEAQKLQQVVLAAEQQLQIDLKLAQAEARALHDKANKLPQLLEDEGQLAAQVATLDRLEEEAERAQQELDAAKEQRAELAAARSQWQNALKDVEDRFLLLKGAEAKCPVCESDLEPEQRRELGWKLRAQREELEGQIGAADGQRQVLETRIGALQRQVTDAARRRKSGQGMRDRLANARQTRLQIEESARALPQAIQIVEQWEARLRSGEFAAEQQRARAALDEQMQALGYDEEEHHRIAGRVRELQPAEGKLARLREAEQRLAADEEQERTLAVLVAERERSLVEDRVAAGELQEKVKELPEVAKRLEALERECAEIRKEAERATRELGAAQSRLERCLELKEIGAQKRRERDGASRDKTNHDDLARIFGKNGIQALIIENAIPEIETEANAILERMTDNGMKVSFPTTRDTKTAGVAETLEIEISDEVGTRKYELYSGGEAVRANFAIRIALSKLLARRAGARLQMLVIDEGFASQDAQGREKLVEALHSIQDEFEKILVITHLDDLKDSFPARIEVTKDHRGSHVSVV